MKMDGTDPGFACQLGQIGLLSMMSIHKADHACHTFIVVHGKSLASERRLLRAHPFLRRHYQIFRRSPLDSCKALMEKM
jgi:hypothetical protein